MLIVIEIFILIISVLFLMSSLASLSATIVEIYSVRFGNFKLCIERANEARNKFDGEIILRGFTEKAEKYLKVEISQLENWIEQHHSIKISKKRESKLNDIISRLYNSRSELIELQEQIKNRA